MIETLQRYTREHPAQAIAIGAGIGIAAMATYNQLRPKTEYDADGNFYDFLGELDNCMLALDEECQRLGIEVPEGHFVVGGGSSAALSETGTVIDKENLSINAPGTLEKPRVRPHNGRVADVDLLVLSSDPRTIKRARRALTPDPRILAGNDKAAIEREMQKPGAKLKIGVCGLTPEKKYNPESFDDNSKQLIHNLKSDFVSHRVRNEDGTISWRLADIDVLLPEAAFQTWQTNIGDKVSIPSLHPVIQMACYAARACHGVRQRDVEKLEKMERVVGPAFGIRLEWGKNKETVTIVGDVNHPVFGSAIEFVNQKNALRFAETSVRMGIGQAALMATKISIHRPLDTYMEKYGQGGFIYDNVASRFSDEDQDPDLWDDSDLTLAA